MNIFTSAKRVLIADDEEDICLYLKRYLERKRFKVSCAFDGAEAKKLIQKQNFDYFILDCSMPNLSGFELIESARRCNPTAKIVLVSGFPAVSENIVTQLGGDLFIHKPIQLSDIDAIFQENKKEDV